MKRQTRLSLVKIAFICFSVCNIVVPAPLKNLSRLKISSKQLSLFLRDSKEKCKSAAKRFNARCNEKSRHDKIIAFLWGFNFAVLGALIYDIYDSYLDNVQSHKMKSDSREFQKDISERTYQQFENSTDEK